MPNSSQSQSKLEKEIRESFKLAQDVGDESVFLQEPSYIIFKAKYDGHRIEIMNTLTVHFSKIKFYHECIYWSYKCLFDRVCDKKEKNWSVWCSLEIISSTEKP